MATHLSLPSDLSLMILFTVLDHGTVGTGFPHQSSLQLIHPVDLGSGRSMGKRHLRDEDVTMAKTKLAPSEFHPNIPNMLLDVNPDDFLQPNTSASSNKGAFQSRLYILGWISRSEAVFGPLLLSRTTRYGPPPSPVCSVTLHRDHVVETAGMI